MKLFFTLIAFGVLVAPSLSAQENTIKFLKSDWGKLPKEFTVLETKNSAKSLWKVVEDKNAPNKTGYAICQSIPTEKNQTNICLLEKTLSPYLEFSFSMKATEGNETPGGGMIWRYLNDDNYFLIAYDPKTRTLNTYQMMDGKLSQLGQSKRLEVKKNQWVSLGIRHISGKFIVMIEGRGDIFVDNRTQPIPGKVGLWTKGDAITEFDKIYVRSLGNARD